MTHWLLELQFGGVVYRFAEDLVTTDDGGTTRTWSDGLDTSPSLAAAHELDPSVSVSVTTDAVDWAGLAAGGVALDRAPATLYRWTTGQPWSTAVTVLQGYTAGCAWGGVGEPFSCTIRRDVRELSDLLPPTQAAVDASTWPVTSTWVLPEDTEGAAYPLVIGVPGDTQAGARPAVPVPVAEAAEGDGDGRVVWLGGDAEEVVLFDLSQEPRGLNWPRGSRFASKAITVARLDDALGRKVDSVRAGELWHEGGEWWLGFRSMAGRGGGLRWHGELLRGAGDVLSWALGYYRGPVDTGRLRAVVPELNAYQVDTWISEPVAILDWVRDELLPWLPVTLRESPVGLYPALWRWRADARAVVAHLDTTHGAVVRDGPCALLADEIENEITVQFRESAGRFLQRRVITAAAAHRTSASPAEVRRFIGHAACTWSQARYGVRAAAVDLHHTWDAATAIRVGIDRVERAAWPRRSVRYSVPPTLESRLQPGAVVSITDPDLHLTAAVALVLDARPEGGDLILDMVLLDRPGVS